MHGNDGGTFNLRSSVPSLLSLFRAAFIYQVFLPSLHLSGLFDHNGHGAAFGK
jgi:hypothetical protein